MFSLQYCKIFPIFRNYTKRKRIKSERAHAKYNKEVSANIYTVTFCQPCIIRVGVHGETYKPANFPAKTLHHQSCPIQDASQLEYKVHGSWHLLALQIHSMYIMAHLWRAWVSKCFVLHNSYFNLSRMLRDSLPGKLAFHITWDIAGQDGQPNWTG